MDLKILLGFIFCVIVYAAQAEDKGSDLANSPPSAGDDSDMYMEPLEDDHQTSSTSLEAQADSGPWYPSFLRNYDNSEQQPLGHSRPFWFNGYQQQQQEGAYSQRNDPPPNQDVGYEQAPKYNGLKGYTNKEYVQETSPSPANDKAGILGDGNFGVIQGGTFYQEKDGYDSESSGFDDFSSYFHNGHGRPSYFYPSNPKAGKQQQFENFRDFADINAPTDRQYSQYVVVYTNKNGTRTSIKENEEVPNGTESDNSGKEKTDSSSVTAAAKRPKNILESLALLDNSEPSSPDIGSHNDAKVLTKAIVVPTYDHGDVIEIYPEKKVSKSKRKLANLVNVKKHEARLLQKAKDLSEPLLALS